MYLSIIGGSGIQAYCYFNTYARYNKSTYTKNNNIISYCVPNCFPLLIYFRKEYGAIHQAYSP